MILSLRGLNKIYGEQSVVRDLSFDMQEGEVVTLLGPSGCGKSTTLRMIAGLEHPDAGEIWINGKLVASPHRGLIVPPNKRNLGLVFQNYAIWPHMTVAQNVGYPLRVRRWSKDRIAARVDEMLAMTRLEHVKTRPANELSGGQQQRVALARALAYEPDILLLDEPLSNLDAQLRRDLRIQLKALQARIKTSFLYVTHDQEEAMALSTKIIVMNHGRIEQIGDVSTIYEKPINRFVHDFIGTSVAFPGIVEKGVIRIGGNALERCPHDLADGSWIDVVSRPEHLSVRLDGQGIPGTIVQINNFGSSLECLIDLRIDGSQPIVLHPDRANSYQVGQEVRLALDPDKVRVFPR